MAGMNLGFGRQKSKYTIDPKTGALVADPYAPNPSEPFNMLQPGTRDIAPGHAWTLDPSGQSNNQTFTGAPTGGYTPQAALPAGYGMPMAAGGSSGAGTAGVSSANSKSNAALEALAREVSASRATNTGYTAPQVPIETSGYTGNAEADRAAYTAAKERTGMALKSALKGLRESMAGRGLQGSGIEGEAIGDAFEAGLSQLAGHDRAMAEQNAGRAFTAGQSDTDRTIQQRQYNASQQASAEQTRLGRDDRALEMLPQIARSYS
jgi:hypothetical protein